MTITSSSSPRLRRDRRGNVIWPTEPVESITGRARQALAEIVSAERKKADALRLYAVTVVCKGHRRTLEVLAKGKPAACAMAIAQYRDDTGMPKTASILVDSCAEQAPTPPEAA